MHFKDTDQPDSTVAGYIRRSSGMPRAKLSFAAQRQAIRKVAQVRGLPEPVFYEDDRRNAHGEWPADRPGLRHLLADIRSGRVQVVIVQAFDCWTYNVEVMVRSIRLFARHRITFLSLAEETIDYRTPPGELQLLVLTAFVAYIQAIREGQAPRGKSARVMQGLQNGHVPLGYRADDIQAPLEFDPQSYAIVRKAGELRILGYGAQGIADELNAAGYRSGERRFTKKMVTLLLRNEFYAAYAPGDDRGTIKHRARRSRGTHLAIFTYEEWQKIRSETRLLVPGGTDKRRTRTGLVYEFATYISCWHCELSLRCETRKTHSGPRFIYRDSARAKRLPCPTGGSLAVRVEQIQEQFGALLRSFTLPENWRERIRCEMMGKKFMEENTPEEIEQKKERFRLKIKRIVREQETSYGDDEQLGSEKEMVISELRSLEEPERDGVTFAEAVEAGEHLAGMSALWQVATPEERAEMVMLLLAPRGLRYDLELQEIVGFTPRPAFLPVLRLFEEIVRWQEDTGLLVVARWQELRHSY